MRFEWRWVCVLSAMSVMTSCSKPVPPVANAPVISASSSDYGGYGDLTDETLIKFKDDVASQTAPESDLMLLTFTDQTGRQIALKDLLGEKHLILVMTRGYGGSICPYCATQTSRLIANYDKLKAQHAEVVVVYPLGKPADTPRVDDFVARAVQNLPEAGKKVPFPLLLDVELKAVDLLGIRKDLSKPATYIFDKEGQLRFAYVGESLADRPSIQALLEQLEQLNKAPAS